MPKVGIGCGAKINLDRFCPALTRQPHQARGRVDVAGGADGNEDVAARDAILHFPSMVGRFAEQNDVRPQSALITNRAILSDWKVLFPHEPLPAAHA